MTDPTNYPKGNQMSEPTTIVRYLAGTTAQCGPITPVLNHCVDRCGFAAPEGSDDWADHLRDCSVRRAIAKASARARSAPQQGLRLNGWRYKTPAGTCPVGHQLFEGLAHECFFPSATGTTPVPDEVDSLLERLKAKGIDLAGLVTKKEN